MAMQLAICAVIYVIFYLIKNTNYIFSEDVIQKTKELLSYDINFQNLYNNISTFIQNSRELEENQLDVQMTSDIFNGITNETTNEVKNEVTNEAQNQEENPKSNTNEIKNEEAGTQTNEVKVNEVGGIRRSKNK